MPDNSSIPATLVAGDTWGWSDASAFASHPPPYWILRYILRPVAGGSAITIQSTIEADCYALTLTSAQSAAVAVGEYQWSSLAYEDGGNDRAWVASGRLTVLPDPATATGNLRSAAERILEAITATIEGRATKDSDAYSIEGRSITRTPLPDLLRLQVIYERKVIAERNPGASPFQYRRIKH